MRQLSLSTSACADLEQIDDYTTQAFGLAQAERLREAFEAAMRGLLLRPGAGRERRDLSVPARPVRAVLVSGSFLVVYEVRSQVIRVARVLHAARNLPDEFRRDGGSD
jgi:plasmid stabilization system protein ParE